MHLYILGSFWSSRFPFENFCSSSALVIPIHALFSTCPLISQLTFLPHCSHCPLRINGVLSLHSWKAFPCGSILLSWFVWLFKFNYTYIPTHLKVPYRYDKEYVAFDFLGLGYFTKNDYFQLNAFTCKSNYFMFLNS